MAVLPDLSVSAQFSANNWDVDIFHTVQQFCSYCFQRWDLGIIRRNVYWRTTFVHWANFDCNYTAVYFWSTMNVCDTHSCIFVLRIPISWQRFNWFKDHLYKTLLLHVLCGKMRNFDFIVSVVGGCSRQLGILLHQSVPHTFILRSLTLWSLLMQCSRSRVANA